MSEQQSAGKAVARVLARVADSLDADQPDSEMTSEARIGRICHFIPGQPDLFDEVFPATPGLSPRRSRREYAAELRSIAEGMR